MAESRSIGIPSSELTSAQQRALEQIRNHPAVLELAKKLSDKDLCIVGGAVRQAIAGETHSDLDCATSLSPEMVKERFPKTYDTGLKHGTVTALVNETPIEVTTFRIAGGSIVEDLLARDFTINAMALRVEDSALLDPANGINDSKNNILRAVGDPEERFREDPLRILRMIRFGPAEGRSIEEKTKNAAIKLKDLLKNISVERIREEFVKILISEHPIAALNQIKECSLFDLILPEIIPSIGFEQNEFHFHDVYEHTLWVVDRTPRDKILRLAALFHDLGKPHTLSIGEDGRRHFYNHEKISTDITKAVMERLRFSNSDTDAVANIVRYHMRPIDCGPAGVRRLMRDLGEQFLDWRTFKAADAPPVLGEEDFETRAARFDAMVKEEQERKEKSGIKALCIDGYDLIKIGIPTGPTMGTVMKMLEEAVIENPEKNTPETLLSLAANWLKQ